MITKGAVMAAGDEAVVGLPRLALGLLLDFENADQADGDKTSRRHVGVQQYEHVERIAILTERGGKKPKP